MSQPLFGSAMIPYSPASTFRADLSALPLVPEGFNAPAVVPLRTTTATYNAFYEFALDRGRVAARLRTGGPWHLVNLPPRIDGTIVGISADDDELTLIGPDGWIYTMDHIFSEASRWNVTNFWGSPFWWGMGRALPPGTFDWSYSVENKAWDGYTVDIVGNRHSVGGARMTMITALRGDGTDIVMVDPWLYNDDSYRVPSAMGGRFQAAAISSSASTIFVTDTTGHRFVRVWDFDRSGADIAFFRSEWYDRGFPSTMSRAREYWDPRTAAQILPVPGWLELPPIPGQATTRVSVSADMPRERYLRVEGMHEGRTGYWEMFIPLEEIETENLQPREWVFKPTDMPLTAPFTVEGPMQLSEPHGPHLRTLLWGKLLDIPHFDLRNDRLQVTWGGQETTLYTIDGLRQSWASNELNNTWRIMGGALDINGVKKPVTMLVSESGLIAF
ncbi:MAG: hypothetical protein Q3972_01160 [Corynebacterium sp.]|nr:hypothetical protein [Corynebacterium sp.]